MSSSSETPFQYKRGSYSNWWPRQSVWFYLPQGNWEEKIPVACLPVLSWWCHSDATAAQTTPYALGDWHCLCPQGCSGCSMRTSWMSWLCSPQCPFLRRSTLEKMACLEIAVPWSGGKVPQTCRTSMSSSCLVVEGAVFSWIHWQQARMKSATAWWALGRKMWQFYPHMSIADVQVS